MSDDATGVPIALITHEFYPTRGGAGVYVQELARAATELGYQVLVLAPGHPRWKALGLPVKLEALATASPLGDWWYFPATTFYLLANRRRINGKVLHICQQAPLRIMMLLVLLGLVQPRRLIITLHGSELLQLSLSRVGGRWLLGRLLNRVDRVAVLSRWVRDELLSHYPAVTDRVVVAPGAPRAGSAPRTPRGAKKAASRLMLLTVGRIHPRKGQKVVLEALARLENDLKSRLRYVIAGPVVSRRYGKALERFAPATGIEVVFTGAIDNTRLSQLYAEADIFVMTSARQRRSVEGFGLAYLEASAYGLPVVGHRTGGVEDAVQDGVTGILVEPGDHHGLLAALTKLIREPDLRLRLGANGEKWARRFSWEDSARTIYSGLV